MYEVRFSLCIINRSPVTVEYEEKIVSYATVTIRKIHRKPRKPRAATDPVASATDADSVKRCVESVETSEAKHVEFTNEFKAIPNSIEPGVQLPKLTVQQSTSTAFSSSPSLQTLIALARANPQPASFASAPASTQPSQQQAKTFTFSPPAQHGIFGSSVASSQTPVTALDPLFFGSVAVTSHPPTSSTVSYGTLAAPQSSQSTAITSTQSGDPTARNPTFKITNVVCKSRSHTLQ